MISIKMFVSASFQTGDERLEILSNILRKNNVFEFQLIRPCSPESQDNSTRAVLKALLDSQLLLVDGTSDLTYLTGIEMALAKTWKIPTYTIAKDSGAISQKVYNQPLSLNRDILHEFSEHIFSSIESFAEYLIEIYHGNKLSILNHDIDTENTLDRLLSFDAGYDEGYSKISNFWGLHPASLVTKCADLLKNMDINTEKKCLDLGCGTGKNAIYLWQCGFNVDAMDASYWAISEAKKRCTDINWKVGDIRKFEYTKESYSAILMTGCLHCLSTMNEIQQVVCAAQEATAPGGFNVLSAFNLGQQDLSGHAPSFSPTLLSHEKYLDMYREWKIIYSSDTIQSDIHPHNNIIHKHSITRILAQKI